MESPSYEEKIMKLLTKKKKMKKRKKETASVFCDFGFWNSINSSRNRLFYVF